MSSENTSGIPSPWLTVQGAADFIANRTAAGSSDDAPPRPIGAKAIRKAAKTGALRHVVIDDRGTLMTKPEWVDQWLESKASGGSVMPVTRRTA